MSPESSLRQDKPPLRLVAVKLAETHSRPRATTMSLHEFFDELTINRV